jgi:hypothetical protein
VTITQTTDDALQIHFRLINNAVPTIGVLRLMTDADLTQMRDTYNGIVRTLRNADTIFRDGVPTLDIHIPAESFLGGPTTLGPRFRSVTLPDGALIGPNSRAAVLIHESTHVIDAQSGRQASTFPNLTPHTTSKSLIWRYTIQAVTQASQRIFSHLQASRILALAWAPAKLYEPIS